MVAAGFLSTPSARRATRPCYVASQTSHNFYPRPPRGGRPGLYSLIFGSKLISIHALREEGDLRLMRRRTPQQRFLSTPSARRATFFA